MKISDLLNESQQLDELSASDIGKGVGKVAKGIGAVAGGIAGIPGAVKKGFQAGKQTVSGAADAKPAAAPAAAGKAQPAQATAAQPATAQTQATPAAEPEQEPAAPAVKAAAKEPAAAPAGGDVDAVKQELTSFLQTYKKDLAMQNKNWEYVTPKVKELEKQVAALTAGKAAPAAAPADDAEAKKDYLFGKGVRPKNKEERRAAFRAQNEKEGLTKKKAPSQAQIDADRERVMGVTSDSVIRKGTAVNESIQLYRR